MNISPSNIFLHMRLPARFHQNCQAVLAAVSINGLRTRRWLGKRTVNRNIFINRILQFDNNVTIGIANKYESQSFSMWRVSIIHKPFD